MKYRIRKHTYLLPQDETPHHYFTIEERWFLLWGRSVGGTFSSEESAFKFVEWLIRLSNKPGPVTIREIDAKNVTPLSAFRPVLSTLDPILLVLIAMIATLAFVAYTLAPQGGITTTVYPLLSGR